MASSSPWTPKPASSPELQPEATALHGPPGGHTAAARHAATTPPLRRGRMGGMTSTNHRSTHREAPRPGFQSSASAPSRTVLIAVAACLAGAAALSACTGTSTADPSATPPAGTTAPPTAQAPAAAVQATGPATEEDPATSALKQTVADALNRLAAGTPKPATAQVTDALAGAGIPGAALEVSESRTPTGLEADALEAAVLQGADCVIGQIRDGGVTVTVLPVLASGKCFVGAPA